MRAVLRMMNRGERASRGARVLAGLLTGLLALGTGTAFSQQYDGQSSGPDAMEIAGPYADDGFSSESFPEWSSEDPGCDGCSACNRCSPWSIRYEGLVWWTEGDRLPPLVTTSPAGTAAAQAGNLQQSTTQVLFGNAPVNDSVRGGFRFVVGRELAPGTEWEAHYLLLPEFTADFAENSTNQPILSRPFFNVSTNANDHQAIAFPGSFTGSIAVVEHHDLQSVGLVLKSTVVERQGSFARGRVQALGGYRHLRMDDHLSIQSSSTVVAGGALVPGTVLGVNESFRAENEFHGFDLGLVAECVHDQWSWEFLGRAALGSNQGTLVIDGQTSTTVPGGAAPAVTTGGLLAQPSNIGAYSQDQFAFVPELGVKVRYFACPGLRLSLGYHFLYWSHVLRPGSHVDMTLNLTQASGGALVGAARPAFAFQDEGFWAQGVSLGVDYRF